MEGILFFTLVVSSLFILSIDKVSSTAAATTTTITTNQSLRDGETLVSTLKTFELGFFTPGSSRNRYLGIWYKRNPETVVWVANRNDPITDLNGVLIISNNGNLVLLNKSEDVIWSSTVSNKLEDPVAELLETGNLVVRDNSGSTAPESYRWQSFDYPTDTFLPGMKLGWNLKTGQETYLTSWKSDDDPSPGVYTCRMDIHGLPQIFITSGSTKKARSAPWDGISLGSYANLQRSLFRASLLQDKDEVYYSYESLNKSIISRVTLDQSGFWQRYIMTDWNTGWVILYSWPRVMCDNYGQCGANAICRTDAAPFCECLKGFKTASQIEGNTSSNQSRDTKCVREPLLDCQRGEGFLKMESVKLPDLLDFWVDESMTIQQCAAECLKNCSCRAYANWNMSAAGKGCLMWFGDLVDMKQDSDLPPEKMIYIRVPASELESSHDSNNKKKTTLIVAASAGFGVFMLGLVSYICWRKPKGKGIEGGNSDMEVPLFDMEAIAVATRNFSRANAIGEGGFGCVYWGELPTGQQIAVKRLSKNSGQGAEEFKNEVAIIAKLQHRNLVRLLGSCVQGEERMLIYEYMPNKSLDCYIFDHKSGSLDWNKQFNIILGIARGLLYLHQDSRLQIVHRDLKPSNILLDKNLNPKISDFGLARIFSSDEKVEKTKRVMGTYGYMSPEYAIDGKFSIKSDVFSFGVLVLEIISGRRNRGFCHPDHHHSLIGHAWLLWNEGRPLELVDAGLNDASINFQVVRCIQVGLLCVQKLPEDRPIMLSVVSMLANEGPVFTQPKQPGFFMERSCIVDATSQNEDQSTSNSATMSTLLAR